MLNLFFMPKGAKNAGAKVLLFYITTKFLTKYFIILVIIC